MTTHHYMPVISGITHVSHDYLAPWHRPDATVARRSREARLRSCGEAGYAFDRWHLAMHRGIVRARPLLRVHFNGWRRSVGAVRGTKHNTEKLCLAFYEWYFHARRGTARSLIIRYYDEWYSEMCARINRNAVLSAMLGKRAALACRRDAMQSAFEGWYSNTLHNRALIMYCKWRGDTRRSAALSVHGDESRRDAMRAAFGAWVYQTVYVASLVKQCDLQCSLYQKRGSLSEACRQSKAWRLSAALPVYNGCAHHDAMREPFEAWRYRTYHVAALTKECDFRWSLYRQRCSFFEASRQSKAWRRAASLPVCNGYVRHDAMREPFEAWRYRTYYVAALTQECDFRWPLHRQRSLFQAWHDKTRRGAALTAFFNTFQARVFFEVWRNEVPGTEASENRGMARTVLCGRAVLFTLLVCVALAAWNISMRRI